MSRDGAHYPPTGGHEARHQVTRAEIVLAERGRSHLALAREGDPAPGAEACWI